MLYLDNAFELDPQHQAAINANVNLNYNLKNHNKVIAVYNKSDWAVLEEMQKAHNLNIVAASFNQLAQYDSAYTLSHQLIRQFPNQARFYITLAENFAFQKHKDSCFYYIEEAFKRGYNPKLLELEEAPYNALKDSPSFKHLSAQYTIKDSDLLD